MEPKGKFIIKWNSDIAYVVGLITTDGNLWKYWKISRPGLPK